MSNGQYRLFNFPSRPIMSVMACMSVVAVAGFEREPKITREIWPEVKRIGMTGYLNCTVSQQGINKVQWIHRETATVLTSDDRVEVDNVINQEVDGYTKYDVMKRRDNTVGSDTTTYMLIVRRLAMTDAGNYSCQVVVKGAQAHSAKTGQLLVLRPPTILPGSATLLADVMEGDDATLSCAAEGYPTPNITWIKANGDPLPAPYNRFRHSGKSIQLKNVARTDRGFYRCIADNNVRPSASYDSLVEVYFPPSAEAVQRSYGQAQNRLFEMTLECMVSGYPLPEVRWYQVVSGGLHPIIDGDKHDISQVVTHTLTMKVSTVWYQLTIINVQANDYGTYVCEGTNKFGSGSTNILVYETSECQGPNCPAEGGFVSNAGQLRYFHTTAAAAAGIITSLITLLMMMSVLVSFTTSQCLSHCNLYQ